MHCEGLEEKERKTNRALGSHLCINCHSICSERSQEGGDVDGKDAAVERDAAVKRMLLRRHMRSQDQDQVCIIK